MSTRTHPVPEHTTPVTTGKPRRQTQGVLRTRYKPGTLNDNLSAA